MKKCLLWQWHISLELLLRLWLCLPLAFLLHLTVTAVVLTGWCAPWREDKRRLPTTSAAFGRRMCSLERKQLQTLLKVRTVKSQVCRQTTAIMASCLRKWSSVQHREKLPRQGKLVFRCFWRRRLNGGFVAVGGDIGHPPESTKHQWRHWAKKWWKRKIFCLRGSQCNSLKV